MSMLSNKVMASSALIWHDASRVLSAGTAVHLFVTKPKVPKQEKHSCFHGFSVEFSPPHYLFRRRVPQSGVFPHAGCHYTLTPPFADVGKPSASALLVVANPLSAWMEKNRACVREPINFIQRNNDKRKLVVEGSF